MSETNNTDPNIRNNVVPIKSAPSVVDPNDLEPTVAIDNPVAEQQAPSPNRNIFQSILYKIGGHREGEKPEDTRRRGAVITVGTAVAGAALTTVATQAPEMVADYVQSEDAKNVKVMEDYKKDGILEEGKVVIEADKVQVPEQFATEVSSGEDAHELTGVIQDQVDAQGDPGVQPGEIAVVDAEQVDPASPQIIEQNLTPKQ